MWQWLLTSEGMYGTTYNPSPSDIAETAAQEQAIASGATTGNLFCAQHSTPTAAMQTSTARPAEQEQAEHEKLESSSSCKILAAAKAGFSS